MVLASFIFFLLLFLGVGLSSAFRARKSREDYYLASSEVPPSVVALSAVATNNSGYMFIGVIGYTYAVGLASIWLMVGWIFGDFLASLYIHRRLRQATERTREASFSAVLARWSGGDMPIWRRLAAFVTIVFLGAYAAAQIAAGGKALQGTLGWEPEMGAWIVAAMVLSYSIAGGIRASIWTDVAQSIVMLLAMGMLFVAGIGALGGLDATLQAWRDIPGFFDLTPPDMVVPGAAGILLFATGWLFAGLSVIGQPHIMVRFMAMDSADSMWRARIWYYSFFTIFYALATGVGMLARLYLPELGDLDPELALPTMADEVLPPVMVGVVLAGIFAATISTADSLVLSCSASMTHDIVPDRLEHPWALKAATALVTALALVIALRGNQSVFELVILSWSTLAVTFGPLLIILAMGRRVSEWGAILMMVAGVAVALYWRHAGWHEMVYEGLPGLIIGVVLGLFLSHPRKQGSREKLLAEG